MFWELYARTYDSIESLLPYQELLRQVIDKSQLANAESVLDVGCGTGNLEERLEREGITCAITAVDASREMLKRASRKASKANFVRADLNLPLDEQGVKGPFDVIVGVNVLYAINNPAQLIRDLSAKANDNAWMVQSTPKAGAGLLPILRHHYRMAGKNFKRRHDALLAMSLVLVGIFNLFIIRRQGRGAYHFPSQQQVLRWYQNSGWTIRELSTAYAEQNWLIVAQKE